MDDLNDDEAHTIIAICRADRHDNGGAGADPRTKTTAMNRDSADVCRSKRQLDLLREMARGQYVALLHVLSRLKHWTETNPTVGAASVPVVEVAGMRLVNRYHCYYCCYYYYYYYHHYWYLYYHYDTCYYSKSKY